DGQGVGPHGRPADGGEPIRQLPRQVHDGLRSEAETGRAANRVLAVDVVVAQLPARELERLLAPLVTLLADERNDLAAAVSHGGLLAAARDGTAVPHRSRDSLSQGRCGAADLRGEARVTTV